MGRQLFLDGPEPNANIRRFETNKLSLLNWNIGNPSRRRAIRQSRIILDLNPDIVVLTEVKASAGSLFLQERFAAFGYEIFFDNPSEDYGVIIASRIPNSFRIRFPLGFKPHRAVGVLGESFFGSLLMMGIYVPSRGPTGRRNVDKRRFQSEFLNSFESLLARSDADVVLAGDLNVIERDHVPLYDFFGEWEYAFYEGFTRLGMVDAFRLLNPGGKDHSWFGQSGDGYRFDHIFISESLSRFGMRCKYIHEPRLENLSDHSVMWMELARSPGQGAPRAGE